MNQAVPDHFSRLLAGGSVYPINVGIRPEESGSGPVKKATSENFCLPDMAGFAIPFRETKMTLQTKVVFRCSQ
ncbi:MAG: hypothetical protein CMJ81_06830 [Planctomycetaceae bacterium]|nr:hypothetical protein [Planctomycetaceae bacterium]